MDSGELAVLPEDGDKRAGPGRDRGPAPGTSVYVLVTAPAALAYLLPWELLPPEAHAALLAATAGLTLLLAGRDLALAFYHAFLWSGLVSVEPAPVDVIWIVLGLHMLLSPGSRRCLARGWRTPLAGLTLGLGVIGFASVPGAADTGRALFFQGVTFYLSLVAVWFMASFRAADLRRAAILGWAGAALLGGLTGIAGSLGGGDYRTAFYLYDRLKATFKDPNCFASFTAFPLLLALYEEVFAGRRVSATDGPARPTPERPVFGRWATPLGAVWLAAIGVAMSRGTWLGLVPAGAAGLLVQVRPPGIDRGPRDGPAEGAAKAGKASGRGEIPRRAIRLLTALLVSLLILGVAGVAPAILQRLELKPYDAKRWSGQAQGLALWVERLADLEGEPFTGIGPGHYEVRFRYAAHNIFLRAALETGTVALLLLLGLYAVALSRVGQVIRGAVAGSAGKAAWTDGSAPAERPLATAVFAYLVFTALYGLVIDTLHWRHLWMALGLAGSLAAEGGPGCASKAVGASGEGGDHDE